MFLHLVLVVKKKVVFDERGCALWTDEGGY